MDSTECDISVFDLDLITAQFYIESYDIVLND